MKLKNKEVTISHQTGEIQTVSKTYSIRTTAEEFVMTFSKTMSGLFNIKSGTDRGVLDHLCLRVQFNSTTVYLTSGRRKEICEIMKISKQTLSNSLTNLKKLRVISGEGGEYEISPFIVWKGTTDEREKLINDGGLELKIKFVSDFTELNYDEDFKD